MKARRCRRPKASLLVALLAVPALALAKGKHEHGVAELDVAIDARTVQVSLRAPLDSLLGFERAPRTASEREQADKMVARLRAGDALFRFDPAAGCKQAAVELRSAPLKLGPPAAAAAAGAGGEHGDLEADWRFECSDAARATGVEVGLFEFNRLKRVRVQIAGPRGQAQRMLERPATRLAL